MTFALISYLKYTCAILLLSINKDKSAEASCPTVANPVVRMCQNGEVKNTRIFVDASSARNVSTTECRCTILLHDGGQTEWTPLSKPGYDTCDTSLKVDSTSQIFTFGCHGGALIMETLPMASTFSFTLHKPPVLNSPFAVDYCYKVSERPVLSNLTIKCCAPNDQTCVIDSGVTDPTDKPVTTTKVTDKPVTTTKVTDKPVTTTKVTDKPVTTTKVTHKPVTTTKVTDKPVTTKVTDKPVTTTKVTHKPVTTTKVTDKPVTTKVTDKPVTTTKVTHKPVTTTKVTDKPVTTTKVTDKPVTTKVTDKPVTTTKVTNKPVTTTKVTDKPVTTTKVTAKPVTTTKVTDKPVTTTKVTDKPVTTTKVTDKPVTTKAATTTKVTDKSMTTPQSTWSSANTTRHEGDRSTSERNKEEKFPVNIVAPVATGAVVLCIVIIVVAVCIRKRKMAKNKAYSNYNDDTFVIVDNPVYDGDMSEIGENTENKISVMPGITPVTHFSEDDTGNVYAQVNNKNTLPSSSSIRQNQAIYDNNLANPDISSSSTQNPSADDAIIDNSKNSQNSSIGDDNPESDTGIN